MQFIFQNKLALRATAPISLEHALKKIDVNLISPSDSLSCTFVESLCWKICRENNFVCIMNPFDGSKLHFVYQNAQRKAVEKALIELKRYLQVEIDETTDIDVVSSTLMTKAVESGMASALLNQGWTSLENGLITNGNIAFMEEGAHLEAISVAVELEGNDQMVFAIAPDIVCFHRIRIRDFLPMEMEERFDSGCEVNLEDWLWNLWDDSGLEKIKCFVLPSLIEGCIMGLSKIPPQNKDFQESKQFWLHKNGLEFPKDCFYVNVQFTTYEEKYKTWFPSSLVFRRSGLMPVAHTIRASKVLHALDNFKTCIAEWNFFDGGTPNFESTGQVNSSLEVSTWVTAKDILGPHCSIENHKDQKCALGDCTLSSLTIAISSLDFRRSKPLLATIEPKKEYVQDMSQRDEKQFCICPTPRTKSKNVVKIVPHFINRRINQGKGTSLVRRKGQSVNKIQDSDGLTKDITAISNEEVEPDKLFSPAIATEGRQSILKAPTFARRKPSAEILQKTVKAESKNTSFGRKSKDKIGQSLTASTSIPNVIGGSANAITKGVKVSKKKLGETDMKAISICLKEVPSKVTEENASGSKKIPKKKGSLNSTGGHQALDSTKNSKEKAKAPRHRTKNGQKPQASCGSSTFELQHTETAGSTNIMQNIVTASCTLDESFNGHSLALVTEQERKELSGTEDDFRMSELNASKDEHEYQTKKAKLGERALDSTKNPMEKTKTPGHRPKNGQKPQASCGCSTFELQHAETAGNINIFQNVVTAGYTLDESFSGHSPGPMTEQESKELSGTKDDIRMSELNANEDEPEYQTKKAKPDQKVDSIIQDESRKADVIDNTTSGVIPDGEIKPKNSNKRNSSALDPIVIDEKVRNCHSTDKLKSLTVPELKCFLSAKKAKVGGKKEELIQRIVVLLSS
ncbi:uncharacterized protein LOC131060720 isoform X4 [Cryptomeria japonica]|uniref:uncharacterized protein LOC131060720 isoform X4 n=1 Tax=Cryptomeria japonica TaxID=3369 RepID=UPI0025ABC20D|nr:uncharacterized protein LOC131060720 isoform X4 [Cryptomeria japonica]